MTLILSFVLPNRFANGKQAVVDTSSLETPNLGSGGYEALDIDIGFRLDIKRFAPEAGRVGHELMLVAEEVKPRVSAAGIPVNHLIDIGVIRFTGDDPDLDSDVICRVEAEHDLWTTTENLRQVWTSLVREIGHFERMVIAAPHASRDRLVRIAVSGLRYFNGFVSPNLHTLPPVYHSLSNEFTRSAFSEPDQELPTPLPPLLFR